ncbi:MAG: 16S rRNA (cytidine(1402)-2'-O)-methyltransferase [Eubacteriales bacterium]
MSSIKSPERIIPPHEKNAVEKRTLYLVGTPIGNLSDITERAKKVLSEVDFIAAEDTRASGRLLAYYGIKKPLLSYFEHNKRERGEIIVSRIENGESCALITDAGMPAISDPGEDIVRLCAERGVTVSVIPGPCAAVSALAVSGLFTGKFIFEGFLPTAKSDRREALLSLKDETRTIIFYEAPHRLIKTLADLSEAFGNRRISLCRELTKINEQIIRTTLSGAMKYYEENIPRGEYVLIMEGASEPELRSRAFFADMTEEEHVNHYISLGYSKNDAIKAAARDRGVPKSEIYGKIMIK